MAVALLVAALLLGSGITAPRLGEDPNAVPRPSQTPFDMEAAQAALQAQAEERAFRFQMSARPTVAGRAVDLLLSNPVENQWDLTLTLTLDATGELLYESGIVVPGGQILQDSLLAELPPGEHPATAALSPLDPETGDTAGEALTLAVTLVVGKPVLSP